MKIYKYIIYALLAIVGFIVGWYILNSIIYGIILAMFCIACTFYIDSLKKKDDLIYQRIDKAYNFINMLNVEMMSQDNVYAAYKAIENYVDIDFTNILNEDMHDELLEIASSYNINGFKMYVETLILYDKQGGDYIKMQDIPTSLCQKTKIHYSNLKLKKQSKLFDITTLYALFIFVLFFLKSALSDYYDSMLKYNTFSLLVFAILLISIFTYTLAFRQYYINKIKGL